MFRSALLILIGNTTTSALLFIRNLFVARLVSIENYGIAATFALTVTIVEMMSTLGLNNLIIQDKDGNDPDLQAGLQGFHLVRSIFSGLILFLLAHPIANFLRIPDIAWAYQVLALVPILRGFVHFDIHRMNREMIFLPSVVSTTGPALLSLLSIWPLFLLFDDYQIMLYSIILQAFSLMITSHLLSQRKYSLSISRPVISRALVFGWPLLINNILLLLIFQGEKLIVGRELGIESLAIFAMGFTLTLTPTLLFSKSLQSYFLPQLSAAKDNEERFRHLSRVTIEASLLSGLLLVLSVLVLAPLIVPILLGPKYAVLVPLLIWFSILQAIRGFKTGAAVAALARAKTENAMISNGIRAAVLPATWYVAATGGDLVTILFLAIAGEFLGFVASLVLLRYRVKLPLRRSLLPISCSVLLIAAVGVNAFLSREAQQLPSVPVALSFSLIFLASVLTMRDLLKYLRIRS